MFTSGGIAIGSFVSLSQTAPETAPLSFINIDSHQVWNFCIKIIAKKLMLDPDLVL